MSQTFTLYQASSPTTPPQVLADIAAQRPDLRQFVAANPAAAPEVLQWLGTLGDPVVEAALARRPQPAAQFPPPVGPPVTGAPGTTGRPAAPGTTGGPAYSGSGYSGPVDAVAAPHAGYSGSGYSGPGGYGHDPYAPGPQSPYAANPYAPPSSPSSPYAPPGPGVGGPVPPGGSHPGPDAYTPAPMGAYGDPAAGYYAPQPAPRNTGVIIAIVVGAVVVLGVLAFAASTVFSALGGGSYGDGAELDRLYDACAAGDGLACDELYWQSPLNSEYEEFGDTCGFRFPPQQVYCEGNI